MIDRFTICAYWAYRREVCEGALIRLGRWLSKLGEHDPSLSTWYRQAQSAEESLRRPFVKNGVVQEDAIARMRTNVKRDTVSMAIGLWNGRENSDARDLMFVYQLRDTAGVLSNSLVLGCAATTESQGIWASAENVSWTLGTIVDAWDPDWANATTGSLRTALADAPNAPVVGWFTYFAERLGDVPSVPIASIQRSFHRKGTLLRSGEKLPNISNRDDIDRLTCLSMLLAQAGLIRERT